MEEPLHQEGFDTAIGKIKSETKNRLVSHGFFGSVTQAQSDPADGDSGGVTIAIIVKGRTVQRSFTRDEIEACRQRVSGSVLMGIIAMVDEMATPLPTS